ncbi:MAG TPA: CopG family transcriptional regulator [Chloroflexi bacterium]|nr:CopG family transcriptional regulator [Chloroflexota bacterium]
MITVRLDPQLEQTINNVARQMGISKSELIRKSVTEFIEKTDKPSPWELGRDLFGKYASGQGNLAADRKALFKEKVRAKR